MGAAESIISKDYHLDADQRVEDSPLHFAMYTATSIADKQPVSIFIHQRVQGSENAVKVRLR